MAIFTFASDLVTFTLFANITFSYGSRGGEYNSEFYICFGFAFLANCQFAVTRLAWNSIGQQDNFEWMNSHLFENAEENIIV